MLTVMALAISVIFVAAVMAAEQKAPAPASAMPAPTYEKYSGVIEKVDAAKKDFSVKSGKGEMMFSWTDKTKVTEGSKELSFNELRKGQEVTVEYTKEGNKSVAHSVSVSPKKLLLRKNNNREAIPVFYTGRRTPLRGVAFSSSSQTYRIPPNYFS